MPRPDAGCARPGHHGHVRVPRPPGGRVDLRAGRLAARGRRRGRRPGPRRARRLPSHRRGGGRAERARHWAGPGAQVRAPRCRRRHPEEPAAAGDQVGDRESRAADRQHHPRHQRGTGHPGVPARARDAHPGGPARGALPGPVPAPPPRPLLPVARDLRVQRRPAAVEPGEPVRRPRPGAGPDAAWGPAPGPDPTHSHLGGRATVTSSDAGPTRRGPLVSVGLPVYNGEVHLASALDAILAQELDDFEVIICNNDSQDGTAEIARDYAARDGRVHYHRNPRNIGLAGNFNRTFELSGGRYFKWWAHDDWHPRDLLSRTIEVLEADPSAVLCATGVAIMDDDGEVFAEWPPEADLLTPTPHVRFHRLLWPLGETLPLFSVMRADALARTPQYRPFVGGDRVLLAQLVIMGGFAGVPDLMHYYRQARMRPGARKDPNKPSP